MNEILIDMISSLHLHILDLKNTVLTAMTDKAVLQQIN